jgi:hypothetical protein
LKKFLKVTLIIILLAAVGGWIYWQQYKKSIVKNSIENAISKGTDSLYFIHYDSSSIDEVNGNASFFNVTLQSDSLQRQLQLFDTASSATIYNIRIGEVSIKGANIAGLISNTSIEANSIFIKSPVIYIISSGKKEKKILNSNDSMAIYEKLLGKFKSINAKEIVIEDGILNFADKTGEPRTALRGINVQLKKFRIDSTRDYQNIISYFVKDVIAKVKEVYIKGEKNHATFTDVEYNAPGRFIHLNKFQQKSSDDKIVFDINNTSINDISTDAFILNQQLKAASLNSDGGLLTFFRKSVVNKEVTNDEIEIDNNYFDEALLNKVDIRNTKIRIYNRDKPNEEPFTLDNVKFNATDIQTLDSGTNIKNLISNSKWTLSSDGFSYVTTNKRYKITLGSFDINNGNSSMRIKNINIVPMFSQAAFSKIIPYQQDLYTILLKDILLTGIDTKLLLTQKKLEALSATLQLDFKVYRDRTVAPDPTSKMGKYPQQLMQTIKFPFSIKNVILKNSNIYYTEKGDISKKEGTVFFKNIQASVLNVTNIKELISQNNLLTVDVNGSFMGLSKLHSVWKMPLNSPNGAFEISGEGTAFSGPALNPMTEPLGMASIKSGKINKLSFKMAGTDYMVKGISTLLYENLKVELLKKDSTELKKKGLASLLTNALIKDANPKNGVVRTGEISFQRDVYKSFFNLVWKGIFSGIKQTAQKL